jgi:ion channel-forming bestrophin family protein
MNRNYKWFQTALHLQNSVLPKVFLRVIVVVAFAFLISFLHSRGFRLDLPILSTAVPSVIIGLLLVFRTNTAYERFWEGRRLWGEIVNNVRNLSRQVWFSGGDKKLKKDILELLWVFAVACKNRLREEKIEGEVASVVSSKEFEILKNSQNLGLTAATLIQQKLEELKPNIDPVSFGNLQLNLNNMVNALGGCERILKTPIPMAYSIHLKQLILLFCFSLPFQFVGVLGVWSVLIVGMVSFAMMGIEEIAIEIENPFGKDHNDLPLSQICKTIRTNLDELMKF